MGQVEAAVKGVVADVKHVQDVTTDMQEKLNKVWLAGRALRLELESHGGRPPKKDRAGEQSAASSNGAGEPRLRASAPRPPPVAAGRSTGGGARCRLP